MKTRQNELSLDTARRLYEQGGEYRNIALTAFNEHELIGDRLPKTWDEYCAKHGDMGVIIKASLGTAYVALNKHVFSDYKQAQAYIAKMKLNLLRDEYRQGWKPNFNIRQDKYTIVYSNNWRLTVIIYQTPRFLSFQSREIAEEFLTNFRELIEQAGDLI